MNELYKDLLENKKFQEIVQNIKRKNGPVVISGLSDVGEVQFISAIENITKEKVCIVTYNEMQAKKLINDLKYFSNDVEYFPRREILSYDYLGKNF